MENSQLDAATAHLIANADRVEAEEAAARPDEPSLPPGEWMRKNLFQSPSSTALTFIFATLGILAFQGVLNFVFSENTAWDAVRTNLRLLFTQAYPDENYTRVWVTMGIVMGLAGLSMGLAKSGAGIGVKRMVTWLVPAAVILGLCTLLGQTVMGLALAVVGFSLVWLIPDGGVSLKKIATWAFTWGGLIVTGVLLREPSVLKDANGLPQWAFPNGTFVERSETGTLITTDAEGVSLLGDGESVGLLRESFGDALASRTGWLIIAAVMFAVGAAIWFGLGEKRRRSTFVSGIALGVGAVGLLVSSTWWYKWGNYTFADGAFSAEPDAYVAESTRNPWTYLFLLLIGAFLLGKLIRTTSRAGTGRALVNLSWLLAPFVTFWVVLRGPVYDWAHIWSTDVPIMAAFALGGAALLWLITKPGIGEVGRLVATAIMFFAIYNWAVAFFSYEGLDDWTSDTNVFFRPIQWLYSNVFQPIFDPVFSGHFLDRFSDSIQMTHMLQVVRFGFLFLGLAALLAPNFVGEARQRLRLVYAWLAFSVIFHVLVTIINSDSGIEVPTEDFAGGFMISIYVSVFTMLASFPLGVILALARTSKLPLFRMMSTVYIEAFRGVPLITMLFFFTVFVNLFLPEGMELSGLAAVSIAFTLFSAAYLAENVRGGLQSIRRGQYEASDAMGLTTVQRTAFIVLPQGLRVSIPPLVGQVIGTFKETSLLAIVGVFDFLRIARDVIPSQPEFLGIRKEGLLFISVVYFIGAYAMSKYSQRLEKQLGVGER